MDPVTASAMISGASRVLGQAMAPAGPSTAVGYGGASGGGLDFSGFTVNQGSPNASGGGGSSAGLNMNSLLMLAIVGVLVLRIAK